MRGSGATRLPLRRQRQAGRARKEDGTREESDAGTHLRARIAGTAADPCHRQLRDAGGPSREVWRQIVDGTFDLDGPFGPDQGHRVKTQVRFLEDLVLAAFPAQANVAHRTRPPILHNPAPVVKLRIYRSGYSVPIDSDEQKTAGTGTIHVVDHDRPLRQVSTAHEQIALSVPQDCFSPSLLAAGVPGLRMARVRAGGLKPGGGNPIMRHKITFAAGFAVLALAGCVETVDTAAGSNPRFPNVGFSPDASNAALSACRSAVDAGRPSSERSCRVEGPAMAGDPLGRPTRARPRLVHDRVVRALRIGEGTPRGRVF